MVTFCKGRAGTVLANNAISDDKGSRGLILKTKKMKVGAKLKYGN